MLIIAMGIGTFIGAILFFQFESWMIRRLRTGARRTLALALFMAAALLAICGLTVGIEAFRNAVAGGFFVGIVGPGVLIARLLGPSFRAGAAEAEGREPKA